MPRNSTTGVFTRVSNSFSNPVVGTTIDPTDADALDDDYDLGLTNAVPKEPSLVVASPTAVTAQTAAVAIQRAAPTATTLTLPTVASQNGVPLHVWDWSTSVTTHTITLVPSGSETIFGQTSWTLVSTAAAPGSMVLYPSVTLSGWSTE